MERVQWKLTCSKIFAHFKYDNTVLITVLHHLFFVLMLTSLILQVFGNSGGQLLYFWNKTFSILLNHIIGGWLLNSPRVFFAVFFTAYCSDSFQLIWAAVNPHYSSMEPSCYNGRYRLSEIRNTFFEKDDSAWQNLCMTFSIHGALTHSANAPWMLLGSWSLAQINQSLGHCGPGLLNRVK